MSGLEASTQGAETALIIFDQVTIRIYQVASLGWMHMALAHGWRLFLLYGRDTWVVQNRYTGSPPLVHQGFNHIQCGSDSFIFTGS